MNDEKRGELTLGEQRYMERVREAEEEGLSLHAYYRAHGLSLNMLYKVRRQLMRKGIVAPDGTPPEAGKPGKPGKLIEVRVADSVSRAGFPAAAAVCRLRHPSGWLIECGMWPDLRWLSGLMEVRP
ncbi:MAG: hypothetical protein WBW93_00110 [Steroidobacteraceae bacterium]